MPPKKDTGNGDVTKLLAGFEDKEVKLLAAAFVSSIGTDKVGTSIAVPRTTSTGIRAQLGMICHLDCYNHLSSH
jgi:hypothetical protein